jgi:hypothetical protein
VPLHQAERPLWPSAAAFPTHGNSDTVIDELVLSTPRRVVDKLKVCLLLKKVLYTRELRPFIRAVLACHEASVGPGTAGGELTMCAVSCLSFALCSSFIRYCRFVPVALFALVMFHCHLARQRNWRRPVIFDPTTHCQTLSSNN